MKFQLFQINKSSNNMELAKAKEDTKVAYEQYMEWKKTIDKITLAEVFKKLDVIESKSVNGYPQLSIGSVPKKGDPAERAENFIGGINALADLFTYKPLEWGRHERQYNPRIDQPNVIVEFNRKNGANQFVFTDWKNLALVSGELNNPKTWNDWEYRRNIESKHGEIERIMQALDPDLPGGAVPYVVVLGTDQALSHYNNNVRKYLESPYTTYLAERDKRWELASQRRKVVRGSYTGATPKSSVQPSQNHLDIAAQLVKMTEPFVLVIQTASADENAPVTKVTFTPSDKKPDMLANLANTVLNANPKVVYNIAQPE